jgi:hypothetical protein
MSRSTPSSDTIKANVDDQGPPDGDRLDALPQKHRDELLKQYDLPEVKVNLIKLLGYGTPVDVVLQLVGSIMAFGAGLSYPFPYVDY